jgi:hypothetical protein
MSSALQVFIFLAPAAGFGLGLLYAYWRKPEELHTLADPHGPLSADIAALRKEVQEFRKFVERLEGTFEFGPGTTELFNDLKRTNGLIYEALTKLSAEQKGGFDGVTLAIGKVERKFDGVFAGLVHLHFGKPAKKGKRK